jgi:putative transposase
MKELASERRRFGYRRLHILLKREGWQVNWKKMYRVYREEGLTVRKRGGRKRAVGTRTPKTIPQGPNQRWSLDFMSDALADGRRFRVLNVIDDFSRECLPHDCGMARRLQSKPASLQPRWPDATRMC